VSDSASRLTFEEAVGEVLSEEVDTVVLVAVVENKIFSFVSDVHEFGNREAMVEALEEVIDDIEYGAYPDLNKRH